MTKVAVLFDSKQRGRQRKGTWGGRIYHEEKKGGYYIAILSVMSLNYRDLTVMCGWHMGKGGVW